MSLCLKSDKILTIKNFEEYCMALLEAFLIFIFAVIISSVINNRSPQIPTAFIQIALGVVIFIIPIQVDFQFNSRTHVCRYRATTFCKKVPMSQQNY